MYFDITKAEYIEEYKIKLYFENNKNGIVDLKSYKDNGGVFSKFTDKAYFANFNLEDGILTWGNGELDIAPETLYLQATGEISIQWDIEEFSKVV